MRSGRVAGGNRIRQRERLREGIQVTVGAPVCEEMKVRVGLGLAK